MSVTEKGPLQGSYEPVCWNFKLLAQHELDGFGGMGEGSRCRSRRRAAHHLARARERAEEFTGVDVSDPRKPKVVVQTDLPQAHMRSNSLETCGNIMAVAYQTQKKGLQPAGMELFDISVPEKPKSISSSTARDRLRAACTSSGSATANTSTALPARATFRRHTPNDDQFYRCIDVRNPSKPTEIGRWWMPGTRQGDM